MEKLNYKWSNVWWIYWFLVLNFCFFGPTVWVETLGFENAIFPYKYPGLFSMSISFFSIITISLIDRRNKDEKKFKELTKKSYLESN